MCSAVGQNTKSYLSWLNVKHSKTAFCWSTKQKKRKFFLLICDLNACIKHRCTDMFFDSFPSAIRAKNHNNKGKYALLFHTSVQTSILNIEIILIISWPFSKYLYSKSRIRFQKAHSWKAFAWICCLKSAKNWVSNTECSW